MEGKFNSPLAGEVTDLQRHSYNAAFYELGLRWHWDEATYRELMAIQDCESRLAHYLRRHQPHMLAVYDCAFLCNAIEQTRAAAVASLTGMVQDEQKTFKFDWTEFQRATVGV